MYTVVFDKNSGRFSDNPGLNKMTLAMLQNYVNDKLRTQRHLFLNEVLDALGLPRTRKGQHAGWVWKKYAFDTVVDFGLDGIDWSIPVSRILLKLNAEEDILDLAFGSESENT